jgi:hypothetical protein
MMRIKHTQAGLALFAMTASGLALADCPNTMPMQVLKDCIVDENAGHRFPPLDYAYIDEYQEGLKTQQQQSQPSQPDIPTTSKVRY